MEELNKFLTEARGECWHEYSEHLENRLSYGMCHVCKHCDHLDWSCGQINDFLTWEGFGKLWQWGIDQEWWDTFILDNGRCNDNFEMFINENLIDPEPFAKAVADFLQKK